MSSAAPELGPTAIDLAVAAIGTMPRPSAVEFGRLDMEGRQAVARSAHRRAEVMGAAARAGLTQESVLDRACHNRVMSLNTFIRHCAEVQHHPREIEVLTEEHPARDLGRQGESRTAVQDQW